MNLRQIELVGESFDKLLPSADAAEMFYTRLFETAPQLRSLFKGDMQRQGARLVSMIGLAVGNLDDLAGLAPALRDLGRSHVRYGVKAEHYPVVGAALLWTLEHRLGAAYTDEVKQAWTTVYGLIAAEMMLGAADSARPAAMRAPDPATTSA